MLCQVSVTTIFLIPGEPSDVNCFAPIVLSMLGFTLVFGCLGLKSHRVYRLLDNPTLRKVKLPNHIMLKRLGGLLLVDIAVLLSWGLTARPQPALEGKDVPGVGLVPTMVCEYNSRSVFFMIGIYVYKTSSVLLMCYMGYKTRRMSLDFSEAKYIFMSSHELLLCALIVMPLMYTIARDDPTARYVLQSTGLLLVNVVCIALVLGTKIRLAVMKTTASQVQKSEFSGASPQVSASAKGSTGRLMAAAILRTAAPHQPDLLSLELTEARAELSESRVMILELREQLAELTALKTPQP